MIWASLKRDKGKTDAMQKRDRFMMENIAKVATSLKLHGLVEIDTRQRRGRNRDRNETGVA